MTGGNAGPRRSSNLFHCSGHIAIIIACVPAIDVRNNHNRIRQMHEKGQVTNILSSPNLLVFYDPAEGLHTFISYKSMANPYLKSIGLN